MRSVIQCTRTHANTPLLTTELREQFYNSGEVVWVHYPRELNSDNPGLIEPDKIAGYITNVVFKQGYHDYDLVLFEHDEESFLSNWVTNPIVSTGDTKEIYCIDLRLMGELVL